MSARTLAELRAAVDAEDAALVASLNRRFALVREIAGVKSRLGLPMADPTRERDVIRRALALADPAERDVVAAIYERLFGGARGLVETIARGICVRDGRVLLCRAKNGKTTYLPGGHIEFGETGREALEREMLEETGLRAEAGDFLGVVENAFLQAGKRHCEINLVYRLTLSAAEASVSALEDWIEFTWWDCARLDAAHLLPAEMAGYVRL